MSLVRFRPEAPTKQSPGRAPPFQATCECSSSGRAPPCQGGGSEFEPRHSLHFLEQLCSIRCHSQVVRQSSAKAPLPSSNLGGTSKTKGHPKGCPFVLGSDRQRRSPPFGISMLGVGKAALPPRFSLSAKMLERRKSAAAQKDRWVIFKIADENLMYLYCHALLKRNTS